MQHVTNQVQKLEQSWVKISIIWFLMATAPKIFNLIAFEQELKALEIRTTFDTLSLSLSLLSLYKFDDWKRAISILAKFYSLLSWMWFPENHCRVITSENAHLKMFLIHISVQRDTIKCVENEKISPSSKAFFITHSLAHFSPSISRKKYLFFPLLPPFL